MVMNYFYLLITIIYKKYVILIINFFYYDYVSIKYN